MFKNVLTPILATALVATTASTSVSAPTRDQTVFEIRFLSEMIDHHAMAVMMADLCLERAVHPELHQLCEQIKTSQMEEIVTLQTWLEDWYGIHHEPAMTPGAGERMQKMSALAGAEFEIEFLKSMIRHHWLAVVRSKQCEEQAYHPELIQLCQNIETRQQSEIELMGTWLSQWYAIHNYHGSTN